MYNIMFIAFLTGIDTKRFIFWDGNTFQSLSNSPSRSRAWLQLLLEHNRRTRKNFETKDKISLPRMSNQPLHCSVFPRVSWASVGRRKWRSDAGKQSQHIERSKDRIVVSRYESCFVPLNTSLTNLKNDFEERHVLIHKVNRCRSLSPLVAGHSCLRDADKFLWAWFCHNRKAWTFSLRFYIVILIGNKTQGCPSKAWTAGWCLSNLRIFDLLFLKER